MYRVLLSIALVLGLLTTTAHGQEYAVDQGSVLLGGSADFSSSSTSDGRATVLALGPSAQYFVAPGLAAGTSASLSYTSVDDRSGTSLGIGPALSYYFGDEEQTVYPFVGASTTITHTSWSGPDEVSDTSFRGDVEAGLVLMIAHNVGLTGAAYLTGDLEEFSDQNRFGLRFGLRTFVF